jgi:acyl carrier protein
MDSDFVNFVAGLLKTEASVLKEDSTAATVPQWDSLNHWLIIGELEEKYGVEFSMDEAVGFENLGDIYRTIQMKRKK